MRRSPRLALDALCGDPRTRRAALASVAVALGLLSTSALAAFTCSISTPGLKFGAYDVFAAAAVNGSGNLPVTCSLIAPANDGKVSYTMTLSTGSSNSFVQRQMQNTVNSSNTLGYNLYTSNTYSVVWGDGTGATGTITGAMQLNKVTNPSQTDQHTVYGKIPALQDAAVGSYLDNVTATVNF
jgi:spore coat protein U-like protein